MITNYGGNVRVLVGVWFTLRVCRSKSLHTCPGTLLAAIANPRLPPTPGTIATIVGAARGADAVGGGAVGPDDGGDAAGGFDETLVGGGGGFVATRV